jgi:hypothetical protein
MATRALEGVAMTVSIRSLRRIMIALLLSAAASPALANPDIDLFAQLAIAPPADRGKTIPRPQGVRFIHEQGWYFAELPTGATTVARSTQARDFTFSEGGRQVTCTAATFPNAVNALYTFSNQQKRADTLLVVGSAWDKAAAGMMTVSDRYLLPIGGTGIRGAAFSGRSTDGASYRTLAVVETTKGTLLLGCTGATIAESKSLTGRTFRLATGAMAGQ